MCEEQFVSLQRSGLIHPQRVRAMINDIIRFYDLKLQGLTVLTEVGSRYFVFTPIIAALAGAKVYAITRDSRFGKKEDIKTYTNIFAEYCKVKNPIIVLFEKKPDAIHEANIITNLGFVRPIDARFVEMMNNNAVVSYMYETWECRQGDVDLDACLRKGIPVLGTNESVPGAEVLNFSGHLCAKMLFELDIEIYRCKIVIVSRDIFGTIIWRFLSALGADAYLVNDLRMINNRQYLNDCDVVVIADYHAKKPIIGEYDAQISIRELQRHSDRVSIVKFVGNVDADAIKKNNIPFIPHQQSGVTMGKTLADLGPKPVINLHAAGLKVGEVMARARLAGKSMEEVKSLALVHSPAQDFGDYLNF